MSKAIPDWIMDDVRAWADSSAEYRINSRDAKQLLRVIRDLYKQESTPIAFDASELENKTNKFVDEYWPTLKDDYDTVMRSEAKEMAFALADWLLAKRESPQSGSATKIEAIDLATNIAHEYFGDAHKTIYSSDSFYDEIKAIEYAIKWMRERGLTQDPVTLTDEASDE